MNFFKYLFWGILGLALTLAFPSFRVDYLVIVAGSCWLAAGLWNGLLLSASLALIYSAFSLTNPILIFIPLGWGLLSFEYLKKSFSFHPLWEKPWLYSQLWVIQWLFGFLALGLKNQQWAVSGSDFFWGFNTVVVGSWILPFLKATMFSLRPTPQALRSQGSWNRFRRRSSFHRNPFGLEKGL